MVLSKNGKLIYGYLVQEIIPVRQVITYGNVSIATGVPLGEKGGEVRLALDEIFQECDRLELPPLPSIVVQEENLYDRTLRHGMPGGGYLVAEANSQNRANRRRDKGWERWASKPRPSDVDSLLMLAMIEAHQDSVWNFTGEWPKTL